MRVPLNANELVLPAPFSKEGGAARAQALAISSMLSNKHSTISTSLLSLQKTYLFKSQLPNCTVYKKLLFMSSGVSVRPINKQL